MAPSGSEGEALKIAGTTCAHGGDLLSATYTLGLSDLWERLSFISHISPMQWAFR